MTKSSGAVCAAGASIWSGLSAVLLASIIGCASSARAQVIKFNALFGSIPSSMSPYYVAPGLTVSPIVRGSGIVGAVGYNYGFGSSGFPSGTFASGPDVTQNAYLGFTVTNNSPATQTVTLNYMSVEGATVGGSMTVAFETSRYGFGKNTELGLPYFGPGGGTTSFTPGSPVLNNTNPSVEFRFYGYNASNASTILSFGGGQDILTVNGTFGPPSGSAAPEPNTAALTGLFGFAGLVAFATRRNHSRSPRGNAGWHR